MPASIVLKSVGLASALFCPNVPAPAGAAQRLLAHHAALRACARFTAPRTARNLTDADGWRGPQIPVRESDDWPRPQRCESASARAGLRAGRCAIPRRYLMSFDPALIVYMVQKTGQTTMRQWWTCAFNGNRSGLPYRSRARPTRKFARAPLHVGMAREPLSRLVSAYGELLLWQTATAVLHPLRARVRLPDLATAEMVLLGAGAARRAQLARERDPPSPAAARATARALAQRLRSSAAHGWLLAGYHGDVERLLLPPPPRPPGVPLRAMPPAAHARGHLDEAARFRAFVRTAECTPRYPLWSHLASASAFLLASAEDEGASGPAARSALCGASALPTPRVRAVLRSESLGADLGRVLTRVNASGRLRACLLPHANRARQPPPGDASGGVGMAPAAGGVARAPVAGRGAGLTPGSAADVAAEGEDEEEDQRRAFPRAAEMRALVEGEDALARAACRLYVQDYVCFGYELPRACRQPGWECAPDEGDALLHADRVASS